MSRLIRLHQRIITAETIKKTTSAMRLIAMSTHAQLRSKKPILDIYKTEIEKTLASLHHSTPIIEATEIRSNKQAIIIVGSQKGLCGNFNEALFNYFEKHLKLEQIPPIITVGKYATEFITHHQKYQNQLIANYDTFSTNNFVEISSTITNLIEKLEISHITLYSNYSKSFFAQIPHVITLTIALHSLLIIPRNGLILEQPAQDIAYTLKKLVVNTTLQQALFNSLLSEQAGRFFSMYTSSQNADKLLEEMEREYNKLRQAKITLELTDLIGATCL